MCLKHLSDIEVSVNHSHNCLKSSNAEAKREWNAQSLLQRKQNSIQSKFKELGKI